MIEAARTRQSGFFAEGAFSVRQARSRTRRGITKLRLARPHARSMFLEYWGRPEATREKFTADGEWLLTGDLATADDDGYLWFASRNDDVINSAGYRIGPAEIESCLMHHPAVAMAAAIGVPDPVRGEVVKAFVQVAEGHAPSADLEREIQQLVRTRLAAYVYPRQIEFVQELPLTTTGKIRRAELRKLAAARIGEPR